ncbi:unnamed protein product [Phyllotreta striolata]|uniref:Proteasome inhibitor PI31 subunit n=1 Tax=Phyllotreta striolata TaxID=444603 RepID=A0A9N9TMG5_PHYSR|nr:unnamed protein product [Phyllotreta striolata]
MTTLFGWDLLYKSVEQDIKNNHDILVCLVHLVLVTNDFKCIGLGESKVLDGDEPKSEALPKNWNDQYAIRYVHKGKLYNLKATPLDDAIMINLIRIDERSVSFVQLNPRSVAQRTGSLDEMIPNNQNIVEQIKTQLIDRVTISKKSKESGCQTDPQRTAVQDDPLIVPNPSVPRTIVNFPFSIASDYGRSDLEPLGGIGIGPVRVPQPPGGGMLFQPPGPSFGGGFRDPGAPVGLPPGALPPGARFDPFRPPDVDRYAPRRPNRPDNDEFPPPGYDDMFM